MASDEFRAWMDNAVAIVGPAPVDDDEEEIDEEEFDDGEVEEEYEAEEDEDAEDQPLDAAPQTSLEFVRLAYEGADELVREYGSVEAYLSQWASATNREWLEQTGFPLEAKPGYRDLDKRGQAAMLENDLASDLDRLRQQGKYL